MLHYDMIRYEIMYLKTLDGFLNTDHSLLCSTYDTPDQFRHLISQILERHFFWRSGQDQSCVEKT